MQKFFKGTLRVTLAMPADYAVLDIDKRQRGIATNTASVGLTTPVIEKAPYNPSFLFTDCAIPHKRKQFENGLKMPFAPLLALRLVARGTAAYNDALEITGLHSRNVC